MSDIRILHIILEGCIDCPYNEYDHWNDARSGYICKKMDGRRIIDWELNWGFDPKRREYLRSILESIPDWCPLEKEE